MFYLRSCNKGHQTNTCENMGIAVAIFALQNVVKDLRIDLRGFIDFLLNQGIDLVELNNYCIQKR